LGNVLLLWLLFSKVAKKYRPGVLARPDEDRVGMSCSLLWQGCDMQAAKTNIGTFLSIMISDLVRPKGGGDVNLDDDEIGFIGQIESFDMLILQNNLIVVIQIRSKCDQSQRRK
jgi:hypothetical protein